MTVCTSASQGSITSVAMGQIATARPPLRLGTILGSCIGLAVYHPRLRIAALAHIVLPDSAGREGAPGKFADTALPYMLRLLAAEGAPSAGLMAKLAGGANMFQSTGPMQIGDANVRAITALLQSMHVQLAGSHVGGNGGRRVTLDPASGEMTVEIVGQPPVFV